MRRSNRSYSLYQKLFTACVLAAGLLPGRCVTVTPAGEDIGTAMGGITGLILALMQWGGYILLVWGFVQFGLSLKNEEPESKMKAVQYIVVAAVIIAFRLILKSAGIIT